MLEYLKRIFLNILSPKFRPELTKPLSDLLHSCAITERVKRSTGEVSVREFLLAVAEVSATVVAVTHWAGVGVVNRTCTLDTKTTAHFTPRLGSPR